MYVYHLQTCMFRRLRLISAALNTSRYVTGPYLSTCERSHQTQVGQHGHVNAPRHARSVMGPECSNYHDGGELCNIVNGHPISSAQRVHNNTEVKECYN